MEREGYTHLAGNTGYLLVKVPQEILNEVKTSVDEIQNDFTKASPYNDYLAGQIDKEYHTKLGNKATQYIKYIVGKYNEINPRYIKEINRLHRGIPTLTYDGGCWVNFQEKYEYNPMHLHDGVFSYVIWYQIPFYKEDEIKYGAGKYKTQNNLNGEFSFVFYDGGKVVSLDLGIDKTMEGYMAIFPSNLSHQVYPFYTSDDYRITISGNVLLQGQ